MHKGESEQCRSKEGRGRGRHRFSISETSDCPQLPRTFLKENGDRTLSSSHLHKHSTEMGLPPESFLDLHFNFELLQL